MTAARGVEEWTHAEGGCEGTFEHRAPRVWTARCGTHGWTRTFHSTLAYASAKNAARAHGNAVAAASPTPAYSGMLNTSPTGGTRGKDTPMTDINQAAPTATTTAEYGVRRANGRTEWLPRRDESLVYMDAKDGRGPFLIATGEKFHADSARRGLQRMAEQTKRAAEAAGLTYADQDAPVLVVRRVVTLTDEPIIAATSLSSEPVDPSDELEF